MDGRNIDLDAGHAPGKSTLFVNSRAGWPHAWYSPFPLQRQPCDMVLPWSREGGRFGEAVLDPCHCLICPLV